MNKRNMEALPSNATFRTLADGKSVAVIEGIAHEVGCAWFVKKPATEPGHFQQGYCNARVKFLDDDMHWECEAGHHHYGYQVEDELEYQRELAERGRWH